MHLDRTTGLYGTLTALGALAGLCGWVLVEGASQGWIADRSLLGLAGLGAAFFTVLLALTGPAPAHRSVLPALLVAFVLGGAFWWAAGRHESVDAYLRLVYPVVAYFMVLLIATPFSAAALASPRGWRRFDMLFDLSWRIVVRYFAATVFVGLFWGLVLLSDALLRIVGLELFEFLTGNDAFVATLTGAVFGLALAVMHVLADVISPDVVLRLLRLFAPAVLAVVLVFLMMLPIRGWGGLLTGVSPAGTLLAFAIAAISLVTIALDRDPPHAVSGRVMRFSVASLAFVIPILGVLALWAIWLRVGQYGMTPPRLLAVTIAGLVTVYGAVYAAAVVLHRDWMAGIREANIWLAIGTLILCLSWLSPIVHPERIAATDQLDRARAGVSAEKLPLHALAQDWGHAGDAVLEMLKAERPDLAGAIAQAEEGRTRPTIDPVPPRSDAALADMLPVYPEGESLSAVAFSRFDTSLKRNLGEACSRAIPGGPGCALFLGQFDADGTREGLLFLSYSAGSVQTWSVRLSDSGQLGMAGSVGVFGGTRPDRGLPETVLSALHAGNLRFEPSTRPVLKVDGLEIFPLN